MESTPHTQSTPQRPRLSPSFSRIIGENIPDALLVYQLTQGYPIRYVNEKFLSCLHYDFKGFMLETGGCLLKVAHPEDRERVKAALDAFCLQGETYSVEYRALKKGGGCLWLREVGKKTLSEDGAPLAVSVCVDITELVSLRQQMKSGNMQLQAFIDSLPCGICKVTADDDLRIIYANNFFSSMLGYTPAEVRELGFKDVKTHIYPADLKMVQRVVRESVQQGLPIFELEHRFFHQSGKLLWGLICCSYDPAEPDVLTCALFDITMRKNMEEKLRISEEESRIAFQHTDKVMVIYDPGARTLFQPQEAAAALGLPAVLHDVPESVLARGIVAEESVENYLAFFHAMQQGIPHGRAIFKLKCKGSFEWFSGRYTLIFSQEGKPQRGIVSYENVTEQREKELAFQKWIQFFKAQQENSIGYYEFNLTKNTYEGNERRNSGALPLNVKSFSGTVNYIANHYVYEEDLPDYLSVFDREKLLGKFYSGQCEIQLEHRRIGAEGGVYWVAAKIQLVPDPFTQDVKAFILINNIDEQKKRELEMQSLIELDALTGLLNRGTVVKRVSEHLRLSGVGARHGLIMLDLDNFKLINDSLGHQYGDQVLKDVADSLKNVLRKNDLCGRLGGDEFVVFLTDIPPEPELEKKLEVLRGAAAKDYAAGLKITASLGLARYPQDGKSFSDLYGKADLALYEAKRLGRDRYVIYTPGLEA